MAIQRPSLRALISVSDKTGLAELASALHERGVALLATGGTASFLKAQQLPVTEVSDYTGFPELLDGRVKTLHPAIHAGILARRGQDEATLAAHQLELIDLVIVNLYPFAATIAKHPERFNDAIEQIDIGGPTLLRAAAKNHAYVMAVVDPADYPTVLTTLDSTDEAAALLVRRRLAQKVFAYTAAYDRLIADYIEGQCTELAVSFPTDWHANWTRVNDLRYGENPHQIAAFYHDTPLPAGSLAAAELLQGKPLSYNNLLDADCALQMVQAASTAPYCVIVKHATPCGVAIGNDLADAYQKAYAADPESAFGGILAFNAAPDPSLLANLLSRHFLEVLLVPELCAAGRAVAASKPALRVLRYDAHAAVQSLWTYRSVSGGVLIQAPDVATVDTRSLSVVTQRRPSSAELDDLLFAWHVVKFTKSNAIVFAKHQQTLGIGTGQTSRVFAAKTAVLRAELAGLSLEGAVMASDAFFPFADSIAFAKEHGVHAIIQPGGSKRDAEVIAAADQAGMAMVFTHVRHFRH